MANDQSILENNKHKTKSDFIREGDALALAIDQPPLIYCMDFLDLRYDSCLLWQCIGVFNPKALHLDNNAGNG